MPSERVKWLLRTSISGVNLSLKNFPRLGVVLVPAVVKGLFHLCFYIFPSLHQKGIKENLKTLGTFYVKGISSDFSARQTLTICC